MRSGECNVVSLYVLCCPVNGSVCFVCCMFVNCLLKQFVLQLLCIISFGMLCLSASVGSVYIGGYGGMLIVVMMGKWSDDSAC